MKSILQPSDSVNRICGKQKGAYAADWRFSRLVIAEPCGDGTLLHHSMTGEMVLVPPEEMDEENRRELAERWFFVPPDFDEYGFSDEVLQILKLTSPAVRNKTRFTILTTTDCNARCFYCYEHGIRKITMSPETARETAEYILRASGGQPVKISWFGGEPLYNSRVMDIICEGLRQAGAEYESGMVSNGFYLDAENLRRAKEIWNLKKVQITIDGTEKVYNRIKAYTDVCENPYRRVMDNIRLALAAGIEVTIRLNMDAGNAEDLTLLADSLEDEFPDRTGLKAYVALLQEFRGAIHRHESEWQTLERYESIRSRLEKAKLLRRKDQPGGIRINGCMADDDGSEVILPDGRTGRCEHFSEAMVTGSIREKSRDAEVTRRWKERLRVPECEECPLYPQCGKLKMCEWNRDGCSETSRSIRIQEIREQMAAAYQEYREEKQK